jgi:hypothetical protein
VRTQARLCAAARDSDAGACVGRGCVRGVADYLPTCKNFSQLGEPGANLMSASEHRVGPEDKKKRPFVRSSARTH